MECLVREALFGRVNARWLRSVLSDRQVLRCYCLATLNRQVPSELQMETHPDNRSRQYRIAREAGRGALHGFGLSLVAMAVLFSLSGGFAIYWSPMIVATGTLSGLVIAVALSIPDMFRDASAVTLEDELGEVPADRDRRASDLTDKLDLLKRMGR